MKFSYIIMILFIPLNNYAQENQSINFNTEQNWEQILKIASETNKIIFIDFYTSWCGPCKRMDSEIFSKKEVIEKFNKTFINYKINAEKNEGVHLSKKYGVSGYPYFAFVDSNGDLIYSNVGYKPVNETLSMADLAIKESESNKPYSVWEAEYQKKSNEKKWLKDYINKRNKLRFDNKNLLEKYYALLSPNEYMQPENLKLIVSSSGLALKSDVMKIISENFNTIPGPEDTIHLLQSGLMGIFDGAINRPFMDAIKNKNETVIENEISPYYDLLWPKSVSSMPWYTKQDGDMWKFIFYRETKNINKFIPIAERYLQKYYYQLTPNQIYLSDTIIYHNSKVELSKQGMDPESQMIKQFLLTFTTNDHLDKLMSASYTIYNNTDDSDKLIIALKWARRAKQVKENIATLELNAKLLYKLKRKIEAIKFLNSALKLSTDNKEKTRLITIINTIELNKTI